MIARTPARFLAPIALIVVVVIGALAVKAANDDASHRAAVRPHVSRRHVPRAYTVRAGDTLPGISHHYGVPVAHILLLNPSVDPRALAVGYRLRLRLR
ncbi:MAG: LysM peptidoglycan-binding domain-containing protein [Solirubrobacteraceae bacterium]|nr:MAG: hypothetical protein DLM63_01995 [Solirubrobacterales bacterium]